jgi:uncharacterized protein with HEPN domain
MEIKAAKRLLDAVEAARRIRQFTAKLNFQQFSNNELIRSAVERQFEIIGEALGRAAEEDSGLAIKIPDLPKIVGLRNRLIHGYDSVDDEIIWDIIQNKVPALVKDLEGELKTSGYETGQ